VKKPQTLKSLRAENSQHSNNLFSNFFSHSTSSRSVFSSSPSSPDPASLSTNQVPSVPSRDHQTPALHAGAAIRFWAPHAFLCVYNLGMDASQMSEIEAWPNVADIVWRRGFPDDVPLHARIAKVIPKPEVSDLKSVRDLQMMSSPHTRVAEMKHENPSS
jgi:hypothetical protein